MPQSTASLSDARLHAAMQASLGHIRQTVAQVADRVVEALGTAAFDATSVRQREICLGTQFELRRKLASFNLAFVETLTQKVQDEINPRPSGRGSTLTDWQSLSLVDDKQVEELVSADRLGQAIAQDCEWELRELDGYFGAMLRNARSDKERNPLRPEVLGKALFRAIDMTSDDDEARKLLAAEFGRLLGAAMRVCYTEIVADLRGRGVQPIGLTVRTGPSHDSTRGYDAHREGPISSFEETLGLPGDSAPMQFMPAPAGAENFGPPQDGPIDDRLSAHGATVGGGATSGGVFGGGTSGGGYGSGAAGGGYGGPSGSGASGSGPPGGSAFGGGTSTRGSSFGTSASARGSSSTGSNLRSGSDRLRASGDGSRGGTPFGNVDAQMMSLLRRLAYLGGAAGDGYDSGAGTTGSQFGDAVSGLMAANMIRAHRDELRQASSGALDHMVIDVVGSLFDQILSDPKVPPQMARQIARLQLPVLRVALGDITFFSSRRHPVRRFVNRIASLACAFEDFNEDPGAQFLKRVRDLVQDIVNGDFDQMEVYEGKLADLETYIAEQTQAAVQTAAGAGAPALFDNKEYELRLQQRYMQQLQVALGSLPMPEFLREFLTQVWSQTIVLSARQNADPAAGARMRRAAREIVLSIQPKGAPAQRKAFLLGLPTLMKDLNEGLALIGWPETARKSFFAQLLPAHAESLKGGPMRELDHNLLLKQLDGIFNAALPRPEDLHRGDTVPVLHDVVPFTAEEKRQVGLVEESAIDWDGQVDIEVGAEPELTKADIDIDIDGLPPAEAPDPSRGSGLIDHIQLGFAYQMHLNQSWQKVRLSYVSPGRAFFVFTRGKKHQQTISMTSRMLARMCDTGRLRAFENAYLIERATARARKQLAEIGVKAPSSRVH